jgi:Resolvase, N terminal domain
MMEPTSPLVKRAIIYTRVSADRAGGRSVEEQGAECRALCEREGSPVEEPPLVDNDRSASRFATKTRTNYERLRDLLEPGDALVTWEASRAQRDLARYVELRDLCAGCCGPTRERCSTTSPTGGFPTATGSFATIPEGRSGAIPQPIHLTLYGEIDL